MTMTVLVKVYPGTGRPSNFQVVEDDNQTEIDRLIEGHQFSLVETGKPDNIDPWEEYTEVDGDGFTQFND